MQAMQDSFEKLAQSLNRNHQEYVQQLDMIVPTQENPPRPATSSIPSKNDPQEVKELLQLLQKKVVYSEELYAKVLGMSYRICDFCLEEKPQDQYDHDQWYLNVLDSLCKQCQQL